MHRLAALCAACVLATRPPLAVADGAVRNFNIPAESLGAALREFGRESDQQILFSTEVVRGKSTAGVKGSLTPEAALAKLLAGSGLSSSKTADGSFLISRQDPNRKGAGAEVPDHAAQSAIPTAGQSPLALEEVVVTAEKRSERLQDAPVPVTVLRADTLAASNELRMQDYYSQVPGMSVTPSDRGGAPQVTIRGITTGGYTNPTVGITVDDVPFGSSTNLAVGSLSPDLDPSELSSIEVLRGPQGTLYGASSIGGLIKFVTVDPTTAALSARVQLSGDAIHHGSGLGYLARAAGNIPISGDLALGVSGFTRKEPGYIDNVQTGAQGVNEQQSDGARLSLMWSPTADSSLKLSALFQRAALFGSPYVDRLPGLGELEQSMLIGTGGSDSKVQAYSAIFKANAGFAEFTSITGFNVFKFEDYPDVTPLLGAATLAVFGVRGTPLVERFKTSKFSQEFRLSSHRGQRIDWLLGLFYTHEGSQNVQDILAANTMTGAVVGSWDHGAFPSSYAEYAAFADMTVNLTDRFDIQFGGRESHNSQGYMETYVGPYTAFIGGNGIAPLVNPEVHTSDSSFTYLVTPRLRLSSDLMLYARLASGYRPGGPNVSAGVAGLPSSYRPDTTRNYEIGIKGSTAERRLTFDASLYYIDWRDIQLQLYNPTGTIAYEVNGSRAKSDGIELSVDARPLSGFHVAAWVSAGEAKLAEALPPGGPGSVVGADGDRLPYSSRLSGSLLAEQEFPVVGGMIGSITGQVRYVGDREGIFQPTTARQVFPGYAQTDLRMALDAASWSAALYVNNVTDRRGLLSGGKGALISYAFNYIQPRTIGITFTRNF